MTGISDIARKTPLHEQDKILLRKRYDFILKRDGDDGDFIVPFYLKLLLHSTLQEKMRAIREHPDLVERIFTLFHDRELGQLYVNYYGDSRDKHHTAYFISVELGTPIRRRLPVSGDGYEFDQETQELFRMNTARGLASVYAHSYGVNGTHRPK